MSSNMLLMVILTAALSLLGGTTQAARILGVFLTPSISHQVVYRGLTVELAKRGHELVVVTTDPIKDPNLKNYKEIDLHQFYSNIERLFNFVHERRAWDISRKLYELSYETTDECFSHPEVNKIISKNSTEHYDLIIVEYLYADATYGLMKRFNAPMIGVLSLPLTMVGHYNLGNSLQSAHFPSIFNGYTDQMNFWERLDNFYTDIRCLLEYHFYNLPAQDKLLKKYFGSDMPYVGDLSSNISMVFANAQAALNYPRATVPNFLEIGGFHLKKDERTLPKELKIFLDGAKEGFIYFSMGSNVKSKQFPEDKRTALLSAFAELPYRVLWKWETDNLPGKPDNVYISKWLPQLAVLAHPKILVFITQGGLQSTEEAISNAVPLIGIPMIGDQEYNVNKVVSVGIAERLNFDTLTKEGIKSVVTKVVTDQSYKERILNFRVLLTDRLVDPMDQAVWWTEYVIRHKGALHLQSRLRQMPWYQRELFDILGFLFAVLAVVLYAIYRLIAYVYSTTLSIRNSQFSKKIKVK